MRNTNNMPRTRIAAVMTVPISMVVVQGQLEFFVKNFERQMYRSYLHAYPVESRIESLKVIGKSNIYRALRRLGLAEWAIANRTLAPSTEETHKFLDAQRVVEDCAARVFRTSSARTGTCSS